MRKLYMRSRNNVSTNVQDNQQHNFKRCNFQCKWIGDENLNWIQCLKCKKNGHIQAECSSFPWKQRKIYNVTNDEEGESNQENNVLTFTTHIKDMKGAIYNNEPSNS